MRHYTLHDARADIVGGLSVAAVAVPQAMAYAMIVGLPAEYGLYAAIVMTAVGALLDSSRQLINGPTNAISIALLAAIGQIGDQEQLIQAAIFMAFFVGVIQLAISLPRFGDLTRYISHSVIVGFTAGASLLLVLDQLKNLLGQSSLGDVHAHFLLRFWRSLTEGGAIHLPTVLVGLSSIAFVLLLRFVKRLLGRPLLPEFLLAVIAMALATAYWRLTDRTRVVVMRMKRARNPDAVGLSELDRFIDGLRKRGVHVLLCGVRSKMRHALERCGTIDKIDPEHLFLEQPVRQTSTQAAMRLARMLAGCGEVRAIATP